MHMHVPEAWNQKLPMCVNDPGSTRRMDIYGGADPRDHIVGDYDSFVRFDNSPYDVNNRDVGDGKGSLRLCGK
jgi:hypothetical protein